MSLGLLPRRRSCSSTRAGAPTPGPSMCKHDIIISNSSSSSSSSNSSQVVVK